MRRRCVAQLVSCGPVGAGAVLSPARRGDAGSLKRKETRKIASGEGKDESPPCGKKLVQFGVLLGKPPFSQTTELVLISNFKGSRGRNLLCSKRRSKSQNFGDHFCARGFFFSFFGMGHKEVSQPCSWRLQILL